MSLQAGMQGGTIAPCLAPAHGSCEFVRVAAVVEGEDTRSVQIDSMHQWPKWSSPLSLRCCCTWYCAADPISISSLRYLWFAIAVHGVISRAVVPSAWVQCMPPSMICGYELRWTSRSCYLSAFRIDGDRLMSRFPLSAQAAAGPTPSGCGLARPMTDLRSGSSTLQP